MLASINLPQWFKPFNTILTSTHGFGHSRYDVLPDGSLQHRESVITVKMHRNESIDAFIERLQREKLWKAGDTVEFISNAGRLDVVRITHKS